MNQGVVVLGGILVGAVLAFLLPEAFVWMRPALRPAFAVTMFFVGTLVRPEQVRRFPQISSRAAGGLAAQYTIMPLSAWAISLLFDDPVVRTGIVIVGCMPGAMASNVMTVLLRGDLLLSVTLTTFATLLSPLLLAIWLPILADTRLALPVGAMVWSTTWMVVLPVTLGIVLRALRPAFPSGWDRIATTLASASIVLILLVVVAANHVQLGSLGAELALGMLGLNLLGYGLAFTLATVLRWPPAQRRTLVVEIGMQNAGLGSVLALTHLGEAAAVPSAFYTALCVITASLALPLSGRWASDGR